MAKASAFLVEWARQPVETALASATSSLPVIVVAGVVNGAHEEISLLLLPRGLSCYGAEIAIGASVLVRVLYHLSGAAWRGFGYYAFGPVMSVYYLRTRKLFPAVFAHVLADSVSCVV